jgi:hypothetical protein
MTDQIEILNWAKLLLLTGHFDRRPIPHYFEPWGQFNFEMPFWTSIKSAIRALLNDQSFIIPIKLWSLNDMIYSISYIYEQP